MSDFLPAFALRHRQDGSEALVDTPVKRFLASSFDLSALLGGQDNRFHGCRCERGDGAPLAIPFSSQWLEEFGSSAARVQRASSPSVRKTRSHWLSWARSTPKR